MQNFELLALNAKISKCMRKQPLKFKSNPSNEFKKLATKEVYSFKIKNQRERKRCVEKTILYIQMKRKSTHRKRHDCHKLRSTSISVVKLSGALAASHSQKKKI